MRKLLLLIILVVVAIAVWRCRQGREVTVAFSQPMGLESGDPVVQGDRAIGEVIAVRSVGGGEFGGQQADLRISPAGKEVVLTDSNFLVRDDPSRAGSKQVVVDNSLATGKPASDHQLLTPPTPGSDLHVAGKRLVKHLGEDFGALGSALAAEVQQRVTGGEVDGERLRSALESTGENLVEWGKEGVEAAEKKLGEVGDDARAYEAKLRREGKLEEADRFKDRFEAWMAKARDKTREAGSKVREEVTNGPATPPPSPASPSPSAGKGR